MTKGTQSLAQARLYGICDLGYVTQAEGVQASRELLQGGVDILQLRAKKLSWQEQLPLARELQQLCAEFERPFVVNDSLELALELGSGLHLGQDDGDLGGAREQLGQGVLLGRSTHSLSQAREALAEGVADYLGFGPLFETATKPGRAAIGLEDIAQMEAEVGQQIPAFCIGGVNEQTLPQVIQAGAKRVCIVSALLLAKNRVSKVKQLKGISQSLA